MEETTYRAGSSPSTTSSVEWKSSVVPLFFLLIFLSFDRRLMQEESLDELGLADLPEKKTEPQAPSLASEEKP